MSLIHVCSWVIETVILPSFSTLSSSTFNFTLQRAHYAAKTLY